MLIPRATLALLAVSVLTLAGAALTAHLSRWRLLRRRLGGLPSPLGGPSRPARSALGLLGRLGRAVSGGGGSANLQEQLARAGYHAATAVPVYLGAKLLLFLLGLAVAGGLLLPTSLATTTKLLGACGAGVMLSFLPNLGVHLRRQRRRAEVCRYLPDGVDLLEVCVSAGMGLDTAWNAVAAEIRRVSPVLADEMTLTNLETHLGVPRADAMRHMAERTGAAELSSLVAVLVQTDRFGTSVSEALRAFAQSMREGRSAAAQELAEKMAVKLLLPMVVFIFPAVMIVMAGPAFINLYAALSIR